MRHLKRGYRIGSGKDHRRSLLRNLAVALIDHHKITTSITKAKTLKAYFDKMVNLAKKDDLHHTRLLISRLGNNPTMAFKLKNEILPKLRPVSSGYTSLRRSGQQRGDNTVLATLKILFNPTTPAKPDKAKTTVATKKMTKSKPAKKETPKQVKKETKTKKVAK